jgi:hypothetical protein
MMFNKRNIKPWSPHDDEKLLRLVSEGKSVRLIGLALRRTPASIYARLKVLRAARSKSEPDPEANGS